MVPAAADPVLAALSQFQVSHGDHDHHVVTAVRAVGGLWLRWWFGFNLSVAVAVEFIALAGVAAESGVVMLIYLSQAVAEIREQPCC